MVYPKPGLEYRYKFKLPDHILRQQKRPNRDHTKIYEMLSDDDLWDIKGPGLRKLDDEESEIFEKEKKEKEMLKEAENKSKNHSPSTATKKNERSSLICALKNGEKSVPKVEVEIQNIVKEEVKEDVKVKNVTPVKKEKKIPPIILYDENWLSTTRPRKRKSVESESVGVGNSKDATSPALAKKTLSGNDDSSKENSGEKQNSKSPKRKKEKPKNEKSAAADPQRKTWRVRGSSGRKSPPKSQVKTKRKYTKANDQSPPATFNLMSTGKIKIRLSALHAYCATAHWYISNQLQNHRLRSRMIRSAFFRQPPPTPSSSSSSGGIQKKKRGPYKKRVPQSSSSSSSSNSKTEPTKKRIYGQPAHSLTPKQALRRVRYRIEKHFAKMPGKEYRCPKMNDTGLQINGNDKGKKPIWLCLVCHKEELDDNGDVMICCDGEKCEDWYHLRCIGVHDEKYPENMKWYCKRCMAKQVHAGSFDEDRFPLYI